MMAMNEIDLIAVRIDRKPVDLFHFILIRSCPFGCCLRCFH